MSRKTKVAVSELCVHKNGRDKRLSSSKKKKKKPQVIILNGNLLIAKGKAFKNGLTFTKRPARVCHFRHQRKLFVICPKVGGPSDL